MDHILQLCHEHRPLLYFLMSILVFSGVGIGMAAKLLIPAIVKIFKKDKVEINVGAASKPCSGQSSNGTRVDGSSGPSAGYCEICPEHPNFIKFVGEIKEQQKKNVDMITNIRIVQENNLVILTELTRQQAKVWERLDRIPDEFGAIKGQLGEIKGMIHISLKRQ